MTTKAWRRSVMRDDEKGSVIILHDAEHEEHFKQELLKQYVINNGLEDVEPWLDSEFNQIFVTYMYPDVTKVN
jgi:hypothetical protein